MIELVSQDDDSNSKKNLPITNVKAEHQWEGGKKGKTSAVGVWWQDALSVPRD